LGINLFFSAAGKWGWVGSEITGFLKDLLNYFLGLYGSLWVIFSGKPHIISQVTPPRKKWKFILSHYSFCAILKAIKEGFILRDNNVEVRKREIHKVQAEEGT
jgi:hypothetical protein